MEISKRLRTIAALASEPIIADIGCDHGLVCIDAVLKGKVKKAYACDLREGPLQQAKANIQSFHLEDQIETHLESGIHNLPLDTQQIIIAGMGGKLIIDILQADPIPQSVNSMILCPHKDAVDLRAFLIKSGWQIVKEQVVHDGHFYPILIVQRAHPACEQQALEEDLLLGLNVLDNEDYRHYLQWQKVQWLTILEKMPLDQQATLQNKLKWIDRRYRKMIDKEEK